MKCQFAATACLGAFLWVMPSAQGQAPVPPNPTPDNSPSAGIDIQSRTGTDLQPRTGVDLQQRTGTDLQQRTGSDLQQRTGTDLQQRTGTDLQPRTGVDLQQRTGTDLQQRNSGTVTGQSQDTRSNSNLGSSLRAEGQFSESSRTGSGANRSLSESNLDRQSDLNLRNDTSGFTPAIPREARGNASGNFSGNIDSSNRQFDQGAVNNASDTGRDAKWRFQQKNNEWWYYSPESTWMYHRDNQWQKYAPDSFVSRAQTSAGQGSGSRAYSSGYRGLMQSDAHGDQATAQGDQATSVGPVYVLQHDNSGREFICANGQRIYFDAQGDNPATTMDQDNYSDSNVDNRVQQNLTNGARPAYREGDRRLRTLNNNAVRQLRFDGVRR